MLTIVRLKTRAPSLPPTCAVHDNLSSVGLIDLPTLACQPSGEVVVPAYTLVSILRSLSAEYGLTLLTPDEESGLSAALGTMPDLELTPGVIIGYIERLTAARGPVSLEMAASFSNPSSASSSSDDFAEEHLDSDDRQSVGEAPEEAEQEKKPATQRSVFEGRERSAPLEATPIARKIRPQRLRGRSETNFAPFVGNEQDVSISLFLFSFSLPWSAGTF